MRPLSSLAGILLAILASVLLLPCVTHAMPFPPGPRDPQVSIVGSGLQSYLDSLGQELDVRTDQAAIQVWAAPRCPNANFTIQMELGARPDGASIGIYDATADAPELFEVFPPQAGVGWFAVASFRDSPARVVVNLFDERANHMGTTIHPGGNRNAFGFYLRSPGGEFFAQDARNPAGDPQFLSFLGRGIYSGSYWVVAEDTALGAGSDRDFDDVIMFVEGFYCPDAVQRSSWGAVKSRFR